MRAAQSKPKRAQSPVLIIETHVAEMKFLGEVYSHFCFSILAID
jgi:hypothetical protein